MQKLIQRTAMAKRQAARKAKKIKETDKAIENRIHRKEAQSIKAIANKDIKDARLRRREDWERGPLAPRRDVGEMRETWGTIDAVRLNLPPAHPATRARLTPFVEGDRVVMLKGRDKGKIGELQSVDDETQTVQVKGLNLAEVIIPEWMRTREGDSRPVRVVEQHIPFSDIRLVYPLRDRKTGVLRDVIINEVVRRKWPLGGDEDGFTRFVPGTNIIIPWPKLETPPAEDQPADTLRIVSEAQTFVPTLLHPPMPQSVLDELRNKYSSFRDRHDPEYLKEKMAEDAAEREKEIMAKRMMTPLKEMHARTRAANRAKGRQELPNSALAKIGELMAAHRAAKKARIVQA